MLYEPSSAIAVRAPTLCRRSKSVLTSFRERIQAPEENNKKVTERCSRNAPELNLFFVLRRNYYYDERRSIILRIAVQKSERRGEIHLGLTTCYLAAEGVVEAQTGAGRVPEQISSSSAATLNRDHFRKETATIYRVTRRT